jgi:hypothetical protein
VVSTGTHRRPAAAACVTEQHPVNLIYAVSTAHFSILSIVASSSPSIPPRQLTKLKLRGPARHLNSLVLQLVTGSISVLTIEGIRHLTLLSAYWTSRSLCSHLHKTWLLMDVLPHELIHTILQLCVSCFHRNKVLELRLVCRAFDRFFKPLGLQTLSVEFSRLSKSSGRAQPDRNALQTIGYHCKAIYVDLMVLRDECKLSSSLRVVL